MLQSLLPLRGPFFWEEYQESGLLQGPLPLFTVRSSRPGAWEAEAALGRTKFFLIGSPYASDFCFSDIAGGPLQVWQSSRQEIFSARASETHSLDFVEGLLRLWQSFRPERPYPPLRESGFVPVCGLQPAYLGGHWEGLGCAYHAVGM